ncbi:helix-turn-helix domain-containing protein [Glutamicibacter sp. AOP5-A2-18]|uniref:helix-turn-helix domain-containing protein n=1 Tax=Glutamicibacter sp. AOP5-A2-18 TaxID=3457656 RepID=UPI00403429F3
MNNETANKVAEAIENSKNATVYSVAKQTGIPRTSLNRKLVGGTDFTVYEIARIAMALGVDPNDLLPSEFKSKQVAA